MNFKLKLKVRHKIYGGFGVIVALLIVSSLSAVTRLSSISKSTVKVNELAVPVQQQSNQLQIALLKQAKLSTLSFNHSNITQIDNTVAKFAEDTQRFNKNYQQLALLVSAEPTLKNSLVQANNSYQQYIQAVNAMLEAIKSRIKLNITLAQSQQDLNKNIDEAGAVLMELSYLESTSQNAATLEQMAGAANQLDGYLLAIINTAKEIEVATDPAKVQKSKETVEFTLSNLDAQINYLKTLAGGIDTGGLLEQFLTEYAKSTALLNGNDNLLSLKLSQLSQVQIAKQQLALAESQVNQATSHLDELLSATDRQFNTLQTQVLDNVDGGQTQAWIMMGVLIVFALLCAALTSNAMLSPLAAINHILVYMARGDLTRELDITSADEYAELAININKMVDDLTALIGRISQNGALLTDAAEHSSNEVSQMSASVEQQKHKIDEVTQITEMMNQSVNYVTEQANTAADEMLKALKQSQQVDNIAQANNRRINDLEFQLEQTTEVIDKLQIESNNIGGIIETIRGIADQTNLLALNAAIEAARAGEQGRGFAVVADEVRSLAGRTQQSTTEIRAMIENLQSQTSSAVVDITKGKQQATECVKHTDELTQSLGLINQAVNRMHDMSAEIANAARQQLSQSDQIKHHIVGVVGIAEQNAQKAQTTLQYSTKVGILAEELNSSVNMFKV
jgi:methyl-accepting chemotaxis protein